MDCCSPAAGPANLLALSLLFGTGIAISFGHCLGMCGPIVAAFTLAQRERATSRWSLARPTALYHSGRVFAYVVIGAVLGVVGTIAGVASGSHAVLATLACAVGALMIVVGLVIAGLVPVQTWIAGLPFAGAATARIGTLLRASRPGGQLALGLANGFLPCGPVWAVGLRAAAAGDPLRGMAAMAAFGLGTVPALAILALGAGVLSPSARLRFYRIGAILIVLIGAQLVMRGLHAFGVIGAFRVGPLVVW